MHEYINVNMTVLTLIEQQSYQFIVVFYANLFNRNNEAIFYQNMWVSPLLFFGNKVGY
jgi:hypothetical protein